MKLRTIKKRKNIKAKKWQINHKRHFDSHRYNFENYLFKNKIFILKVSEKYREVLGADAYGFVKVSLPETAYYKSKGTV